MMRRREFIALLGGAVRRQPDARSRHPLLGVPFGARCAKRSRTERGGVASAVISLLGLDVLGIVH
jgi:hypothetical protein